MKIVTVNVPESYIEAIDRLVGQNGLYPSRSELIRCAVREFLIQEMKMAKNIINFNQESEIEDSEDRNYVKIPVDRSEKNEPVREFKTYKIVRRLEH